MSVVLDLLGAVEGVEHLGFTAKGAKCGGTFGRFPNKTGWWFQIFFIFTPTWGRFPF